SLPIYRHGFEHSIVHRIFDGCGADDFCGGDGSIDWRGCRATPPRAHRRAVVEQRAVGGLCQTTASHRDTLQRSHSGALLSETAATMNAKFARMNRSRRRQLAGIKMEPV